MKVGFTGTRDGLTHDQETALHGVMIALGLEGNLDTELHHGDCVGADLQAHYLAWKLGWRVVIHPPTDAKHRAWANTRAHRYSPSTVTREAKPYIERNHAIVDECDVLIACPSSGQEVMRSGTWATMRYARNHHTRLIVVLPNGVTWSPQMQGFIDFVNAGGTDEHGGKGER